MKNAYLKDIFRSIYRNGKRFLSILVITALGVTVLTGIYATCQDMYYSADQFYDGQKLFDIRILSTLGLTEEDAVALQAVTGVAEAEGGYSETVYTDVSGSRKTAEVIVLSERGLNRPYLQEGALPERAGEIAVTRKYIDASGKQIGDSITIEEDLEADGEDEEKEGPAAPVKEEAPEEEDEDSLLSLDWDSGDWEEGMGLDDAEEPNFLTTTFIITGIVLDPMQIGNSDNKEFRAASAAADHTFFITPADVDSDVYTSVYLTLERLSGLNSYSTAYEDTVIKVVGIIEAEIMKQRQQARYDAVMDEALKKLGDAEATVREKLAEADELFADAWVALEDARQELLDGEIELTKEEQKALKELADARQKLVDGRLELLDAEAELADGERELAENEEKLADGRATLEEEKQKAYDGFAEAEELFADRLAEMSGNRKQLDDGVAQLRLMFGVSWPQQQWDALVFAAARETIRLMGENPRLEQNALTAQVSKATSSQQAALKGKIKSPDLAEQAVQAGIGLGVVQGSREIMDAQADAIAGGIALLEGKLADLEASIGQLQAGVEQFKAVLGPMWPGTQWNALVSAAANEAARLLGGNLEIDEEELRSGVYIATVLQQAELENLLPEEMAASASGMGMGLGLLQGSKLVLNGQLGDIRQAEEQLEAGRAQLDQSAAQVEAGVEQLTGLFGYFWPQKEWNSLVSAAMKEAYRQLDLDADISEAGLSGAVYEASLDQQAALEAVVPQTLGDQISEAGMGLGLLLGSRKFLDEQMAEYEEIKADALVELAEAEAELEDGLVKLEEGRQELIDGRAELEQGWIDLKEGEEELNREESKALRKIADAKRELADGKIELADGEAELADHELNYLAKKSEAEEKLADAYAELKDIDMTKWYVQDRTGVDSYSSLKSDISSIEALGRVFPILFLLVAILISLTTMTRMVEEDRGLIGTYKALGFSDLDIYKKYLWYALLASGLGGVAGDFLGFVALPVILIRILQALYIIPNIALQFSPAYGIGGALLFIACNVAATAWACYNELRQTPAALMRPKAPRAGSRVALERITPVWNRLSFLNKVTARNLFRYKKRLFMTVIGIMGCTALVLCGFAIRDSVTDLLPKQYEKLYQYDLMLAAASDDHDELTALAESEEGIRDFIPVQTGNIKILNTAGAAESVQLYVVPDGGDLSPYIRLLDLDGEPLTLEDEGILLTQNAAELLKLETGDSMTLQTMTLERCEATITNIAEQYLGNHVFMTAALYESLLGAYEPNAALAHMDTSVTDQPAYADILLEKHDFLISSVSTQKLREEFFTNFALVNSVVYLMTALAAGLAFVVLFTLSNTNISERERELATIKVLGFYDGEVHTYANKETLILTGLGVLAGLPVGRLVSGLLTQALKMPGIYFAVYLEPGSYVISALISFGFALIVTLITNRTLDRIDMVEALKSVE